MEISFLDVLITVFFLVALAIPGFILVKTKLLNKSAESVLSNIVLYVSQPMLVFMAFQKSAFNPEIGINMLIVAGLAMLAHILMIVFLFLVFRKKESKINCLKFASVFSNCGFMGMPFLQTLFTGSVQGEMLIYGGVVISVFNLLTWSIGVFIMTGDKSKLSVKKAILNPTVIALILGVLAFLILQKPIVDIATEKSVLDTILEKMMQSVNFLAEMVTPASMMVIGMKLSNVNLKKLFLDKWAYIVALNKLVIMGLLTTLLVAFLPISQSIKYVLVFLLSMPSATSSVMFAVRFNGDSESGTVFVLLTTILSVISIPLIYMLCSALF